MPRTINGNGFRNQFGFSVVFDRNMYIQSAGLHLQTLCSEFQQEGTKINDIFEIKEPGII